MLCLLTVFRLFTNCEFVPKGDEFVCKAECFTFPFLCSFGCMTLCIMSWKPKGLQWSNGIFHFLFGAVCNCASSVTPIWTQLDRALLPHNFKLSCKPELTSISIMSTFYKHDAKKQKQKKKRKMIIIFSCEQIIHILGNI